MKCKEHTRYSATRMPKKTVKYPDGCPTCWGIWDAAKVDVKRRLRTVSVELTIEDARRAAIALDTLINHRTPENIPTKGKKEFQHQRIETISPALRVLYVALAQAVREVV